MKDRFIKYALIIFLIIQMILVGYLNLYFFINDEFEEYSEIKISGNQLLSEENYISFLQLEKYSESKSLNFIKTKLEEHPYISNANVSLSTKNVLEISIEEKHFYATIIKDFESYFISRYYEFVKIIPYTNNPVLPLIVLDEELNSKTHKDNKQIFVAFKVIDTLKELNKELLERLIEINLSDKSYMVLLFKNINAPVIMNKTNIVKELASLNELLNLKNNTLLENNTKYIDLRFNNQIIIG